MVRKILGWENYIRWNGHKRTLSKGCETLKRKQPWEKPARKTRGGTYKLGALEAGVAGAEPVNHSTHSRAGCAHLGTGDGSRRGAAGRWDRWQRLNRQTGRLGIGQTHGNRAAVCGKPGEKRDFLHYVPSNNYLECRKSLNFHLILWKKYELKD